MTEKIRADGTTKGTWQVANPDAKEDAAFPLIVGQPTPAPGHVQVMGACFRCGVRVYLHTKDLPTIQANPTIQCCCTRCLDAIQTEPTPC